MDDQARGDPLRIFDAEDPWPVRPLAEHTPVADLAATFGRADLVPEATIGSAALLGMNDPRSQGLGIPGGGAVAAA